MNPQNTKTKVNLWQTINFENSNELIGRMWARVSVKTYNIRVNKPLYQCQERLPTLFHMLLTVVFYVDRCKVPPLTLQNIGGSCCPTHFSPLKIRFKCSKKIKKVCLNIIERWFLRSVRQKDKHDIWEMTTKTKSNAILWFLKNNNSTFVRYQISSS